MKFRIYTKPGCPYCDQAKELIRANDWTYDEEVHDTPDAIMQFKAAGYATFPQIFLNEERIGGFDDLTLWSNDQGGDDF